MNSAGTYEVDIEVRKVGQAIPGLRVFCDGWKREARQDVGVGVLRSVLYRKNGRIQEVNEWNRRIIADFSLHQVRRAERS